MPSRLVRRGLDTEEIVQRFLAERRIVASLEHPNIARLLDGGITEYGRPYLVMEYVAGEPIDRSCDSKRLTIEERIRLFVAVCGAVHHAHRNLVVHRDLKPSNILVSAAGEAKLVAFGIAKPLTEEGAPRTRTGVRLLTTENASPEQVRGDRVTTTSDVYALGLVLYELLCGRRAIRTEGRAPGDVERAILEEESPRPSSVVLSTEGVASGRAGEETTAKSIAWARRSEPRRLSRLLRGWASSCAGIAGAWRRPPRSSSCWRGTPSR